jgi:hypothetical protein
MLTDQELTHCASIWTHFQVEIVSVEDGRAAAARDDAVVLTWVAWSKGKERFCPGVSGASPDVVVA